MAMPTSEPWAELSLGLWLTSDPKYWRVAMLWVIVIFFNGMNLHKHLLLSAD